MSIRLIQNIFRQSYVHPLMGIQQTVNVSSNAKVDPNEPIQIENPFKREQKKCILCELNIIPDYKNVRLLSQFQSRFTGKIYGRHITGLCKNKHDQIEREMLKSQTLSMMPGYHKFPEFYDDPKLFDPEHPIRPHSY